MLKEKWHAALNQKFYLTKELFKYLIHYPNEVINIKTSININKFDFIIRIYMLKEKMACEKMACSAKSKVLFINKFFF